MALPFSNHPRKNNAVQAFQWRLTDGEQLPYVKFDTPGGYYYFDNQLPAPGNLFPIHDGDWVVQDGNGPNTRFYVVERNDFPVHFNP